jgi:DNA invertase Pin-like site-specific DNA recombinase
VQIGQRAEATPLAVSSDCFRFRGGLQNVVWVVGATNMRKAALYLRVGPLHKTSADPEQELLEVAKRIGCEIVKVYRDDGIGAAAGKKRPQLDSLRWDASNRKFEMVMAWSVGQLGRSLRELISFLAEVHALNIDLYVHQQALDTTTPAGRAMFQMTEVFVEFERAIALERLRVGSAKARQYGKKLGRRRIDPAIEAAIRDALRKGDAGMIRIAQRFGVGTGTVQRIKAEMTS